MEEATPLSTFVHEPLDTSRPSIRLLDLQPRTEDGKIRCKIRSQTLSTPDEGDGDAPLYRALSYVWGDDAASNEITINGKLFYIRSNLTQFLHAMQFHYPEGLQGLWIDAICIDQGNIAERNYQVEQMKVIYQKANAVLIWLGRAMNDSDKAFDILQDSGARPLDENKSFGVTEELRTSLTGPILAAGPALWQPFGKLCKRDYWKRLWVIQELLLASRIVLMCGQKSMIWPIWSIALDFIANTSVCRDWTGQLLTTQAYLSCDQRFLSRINPSSVPLLGLIEKYGDCLCFDPRDKVYGLLGLAADVSTLEVDYSCSPELLFQRVVYSNRTIQSMAGLLKLLEVLELDLSNFKTQLSSSNMAILDDVNTVISRHVWLVGACHHPNPSEQVYLCPCKTCGTAWKSKYDFVSAVSLIEDNGLVCTREPLRKVALFLRCTRGSYAYVTSGIGVGARDLDTDLYRTAEVFSDGHLAKLDSQRIQFDEDTRTARIRLDLLELLHLCDDATRTGRSPHMKTRLDVSSAHRKRA